MSATARRKIIITFNGDVAGEQEYEAAEVSDSVAAIQTYTMAAATPTVFICPASSDQDPKSATIIKPSDYAGTLTLKGLSGDTGILLSPTEPDTITMGDGQTSFVLLASAECFIRVVWT